MSSVLSQGEVDSLLRGISGGEFDNDEGFTADESDAVPYDLSSQDRIVRGRMPTLEIVHDRFVRMFRLTLSSALRKVVDISVRATELVKFGEFLKTMPVPCSLNLFRMNPLRGNAIMVLETRLVFTLIDLFFGGTGEVGVRAEGRDFSAIELRMIRRVVVSALEDLQQSWRPVFPVQITYTRSEINPQFVSIVPHSEVVVVTTFDVEMGRAPMSIVLCVPYSMIEPIRARLNTGFQSDQNEVDTIWLNRFRTNLESAKVEIIAELGKTQMKVAEFLKMKSGDLIELDQEVDKPLKMTIEGVIKFLGYLGSYKGSQSIKVDQLVYKPPVVDEILLL